MNDHVSDCQCFLCRLEVRFRKTRREAQAAFILRMLHESELAAQKVMKSGEIPWRHNRVVDHPHDRAIDHSQEDVTAREKK